METNFLQKIYMARPRLSQPPLKPFQEIQCKLCWALMEGGSVSTLKAHPELLSLGEKDNF